MKVEEKVVRCLNRLCAINLGGIASNGDLTGLIDDYFLNDVAEDDQDSFFLTNRMRK